MFSIRTQLTVSILIYFPSTYNKYNNVDVKIKSKKPIHIAISSRTRQLTKANLGVKNSDLHYYYYYPLLEISHSSSERSASSYSYYLSRYSQNIAVLCFFSLLLLAVQFPVIEQWQSCQVF